MNYNKSLDFLKGILILFVFLGHFIIGEMDKNMVRYLIYSFHMPLFIGVSGYLFNYEILNTEPRQFKKKIFFRIIIPYIVANIFYGFIINIKFLLKFEILTFFKYFIKNIIYSYYHLWYIQGYFSYIIISYFLIKKVQSKIKILIIAMIISIFIYILYFFSERNNVIINIFLNNLRLYNLIFFLIGYFVKERILNIKINKILLFILGIFLFGNSILSFFSLNKVFIISFFYIANILTIIFLLKFIELYPNLEIKQINFIGKNSLYFYLYHIFPLIILKNFIYQKSQVLYYFLGVILFYVLYKVIKLYKTKESKNV